MSDIDDDNEPLDGSQPEEQLAAATVETGSSGVSGADVRSRGYASVAAEMAAAFTSDVILVYDDAADDDRQHAPLAAGDLGHSAALDEGTTADPSPASRRLRHTSLQKAAFHIFKSNVGVGIFLLPMVYRDAGYFMSPFFTALLGCIVIDATVMLLEAKETIGDPKIVTYSDMVHVVLGSRARTVCNTMIVLVQFGFCLLYIQTAAVILTSILAPNSYGAYAALVIVEAAALLPFTFLSHDLPKLAVASAIATATVLFATVATLGYALSRLFFHSVSPTVTAAGQVQRWPMFIASHLSALEGVAVVLPVADSVRKDRRPRFRAMMVQALSFIVMLYVGYSMIGYLAYGDALTSSIVSVLGDGGFATLVRLSLAVNLLLTFPIQYCPGIQICDRYLGIPGGAAFDWRDQRAVAVRVGIQLCIVVAALLVGPQALGFVLSLVGAVAATSVALIFPSLLELFTGPTMQRRSQDANHSLHDGWVDTMSNALVTVYADGSRHWSARRVRAVGYIALGLLVMLVGTITCFTQPGNG